MPYAFHLATCLLGNMRLIPISLKATPSEKEYSQQFKFRISMGNISEIWQLTMKRGAIINSPAHMSGTHEHIMVNSGSLMLRLHNDQNIVLEAGTLCFQW